MVIHRGDYLVEHGKFAPRGENDVYIGTGMDFGRRTFLGHSSRLNRVYTSTDCVFDEQLFPYRQMDMCVSFKIKQNSQGNVTEDRARFNDDGR
jgi:hypothetical protein